MIVDAPRSGTYQRAIHKHVKPGATVVDIGCGSGILSFFAAQAGAKRIFAIDFSPFIAYAKMSAARNGFAKKIQFIRSDLFKARTPEPADVLVHDQIGTFFWNEDMLRKISFCRGRFLKQGGKILPHGFEIYLVPVHLSSLESGEDDFKRRHWGLDFSVLAPLLRKQFLANLRPKSVMLNGRSSYLAEPVLANAVSLYEASPRIPKRISVDFKVDRGGRTCTGVLGFFVTRFDEKLSFRNGPEDPPTNWKQFLLPLGDQRLVKKNDRIRFTLDPAVDIRDWSWSVSYKTRSRKR